MFQNLLKSRLSLSKYNVLKIKVIFSTLNENMSVANAVSKPVLIMCKLSSKCCLGSVARSSSLSYSYLLATLTFVLCSVYLVEYTLNLNPMIEIAP